LEKRNNAKQAVAKSVNKFNTSNQWYMFGGLLECCAMSEMIRKPGQVISVMTVLATSQPLPRRFLDEILRATARTLDMIAIKSEAYGRISLALFISGCPFCF
jgi:hypothetical protein